MKRFYNCYLLALSAIVVFGCKKKDNVNPPSHPTTTIQYDTSYVVSTFISNAAKVDNTNTNWGIYGMTADNSGNIYIADARDIATKKISAQGTITTIADDGQGIPAGYSIYSYSPVALTLDKTDNFYIGYISSNLVRKVTTSGTSSKLGGQAGIGSTLPAGSTIGAISCMAADSKGNLFVGVGNCILKISAQGSVSVFAGSTNKQQLQGYIDGPGSTALFFVIAGMTIDASDNLYVTEEGNNDIRKITPDGTVSTFAGIPEQNAVGLVNGPGASAKFNTPFGIAIDQSGNLYVADQGNLVVRKITPAGVVSTLAGNAQMGDVDGPAATAEFYVPLSVTVDSSGNIYIGDKWNNAIRKISRVITQKS